MKLGCKRIAAFLLALVMTVGLLPALRLNVSAYSLGDTEAVTIGTLDQNDVVSLPITIRDYNADGMLFEFAEATTSNNYNNHTVSDDYVTLPKPALGYNLTAMEKFADGKSFVASDLTYLNGSNYVLNGNLRYHFGKPYDARYATFEGVDEGDGGGFGLGARTLIRWSNTATALSNMRYMVLRYRIVTDDGNDGVPLRILFSNNYSNATYNALKDDTLYCAGFDGSAATADGTVIRELQKESDAADAWRIAVVDLYEARLASLSGSYVNSSNETVPYSFTYNTLTTSTSVKSTFLCMEYGKEDVIDVSCVAFFANLTDDDGQFNNDAAHFIQQDYCYRTGTRVIEGEAYEYTYDTNRPNMADSNKSYSNATICLNISSGQDVFASRGGTETISTALVAEGFSELGSTEYLATHARYLELTDTGKGYGIGFRALLMNNITGVTLQNMRYALVRYRVKDPGSSTASSIPMYLIAETTTDSWNKSSAANFLDANFSNQAVHLSRFNALTDGEWHTALVDFHSCVNQYPTGENYYYRPYNGSDTIVRLGIADSYQVYGNTIELAYVNCFPTQAAAEDYRDDYDLWAANGYTGEQVTEIRHYETYTAATGNSETRSYYKGNNVAFGFLRGSSNMANASGIENYYSSADIDSVYASDFTTYTSGSAAITNVHGITATSTSKCYTLGLVELTMGQNGPQYVPHAVDYYADTLEDALNVPESFYYNSTQYYSYNYVAGEADGAKYGYYDYVIPEVNGVKPYYDANAAGELPRDCAGWLRWKLGITNEDGSLTGAAAPDYTALGRTESYADTLSHADGLTGRWTSCLENIQTFHDAAYYMLNNLYVDDALGDEVTEYEYVQLTAETKTGESKSHYVFDASYSNVHYNYDEGVIANDGTQDTGIAKKLYFYTNSTNRTTQYPFLPILPDMPEFKQTVTPYFLDEGGAVVSTSEATNSYYNRDYGFVAECHGHFLYEENDKLYFTFEGDDDVYLFINGQLVMDLGAAHSIANQTIDLNTYVTAAHTAVAGGNPTDRDRALALEDGTNYSFDFYYMERHGYGANLHLDTNIRVYNENITATKSAVQNGTQLEDYGVAQFGSELEYSFSITNNSDENAKPLYNYLFNDQELGFLLSWDMDCDSFYASPSVNPLGSYVSGGTTVQRSFSDLTVEVTNANGVSVAKWGPSEPRANQILNLYALRDLMDDLTFNDIPEYGGSNHPDGKYFQTEEDCSFYLKLSSPNWFASGASDEKIVMWAWGSYTDEHSLAGKWYTFEQFMDPNTGKPVEGVYFTRLDAGIWRGFNLLRMDKNVAEANYWSSYWNRTGNIDFMDGGNCLEGFTYVNGDGTNDGNDDVTNVEFGQYKPTRRGLKSGETLTVSGIKDVIDANRSGVYSNTVMVKAGINPGAASFHLVGAAGAPEYYAGVGQTLTVPLRRFLRDAGKATWDQDLLYRCTITGFRQNDSSGEIVIDRSNHNLVLNFTSPGVKQLYFTYEGNTLEPLIHATVYVYEAADSTYVLDFDGSVNLGSGSDEAFTANDTLSLNGVSTSVTHEAITDSLPLYANNGYSYPYGTSGADLWALREPTAEELAALVTQYSVTVTAADPHLTVSGGTVANGVSTQTVNENAAMTSVTVMPTDPVKYAIPAPTVTGGNVTATFTPATDVLYFDLSAIGYWRDALAVQSAYFFGGDQPDHWEKLVPVTDTVYACIRPAGYTKVILVRHNPATYDADPYWGSKWTQSNDLTLPTVAGQNYLDAFKAGSDGNTEHWTVYGGTVPFGGYTITGTAKANTTVTFSAPVERLDSFPITKGAYNNCYSGTLSSGTAVFLTDSASRITGQNSETVIGSSIETIYLFDSDNLLTDTLTNSPTNAQRAATSFLISVQSSAPQKAAVYRALQNNSSSRYVTYNMGSEGIGYTIGNFLVWSGDPATVGQTVTQAVSNGSTLDYDMTTTPQGHLNNNASPAAGADLNNTVTVSYDSTNGYVAMTDTGADWWCGFGGSVRIWNSSTAVSAADLRYVAIKYLSNSADNFYLFGSQNVESGNVPYGNRGTIATAKITPQDVGEWETVVLDLYDASTEQYYFPCYSSTGTKYNYGKFFDTISTVKSLFFGLESGKTSGIIHTTPSTATGGATVKVAYVAFFANEADAEDYVAAHEPVLVGTSGPKYYQGTGEAALTGGAAVYGTAEGSFSAALSASANATPALSFTPDGFLTGPHTVYLTSRVRSTGDLSPAYLGDADYHSEVELTQAVTVVPASVVYYEDGNSGIHYHSGTNVSVTWNDGSTAPASPAQTAGQGAAYGYDAGYASQSGHYSGSGAAEITYTGNAQLADFDFTGTGFDLYSSCSTDGASVRLLIYEASDLSAPVRSVYVSTEFSNQGASGDEAMYQVPVTSVRGLDHGDYHVELWGVGRVDMTGWSIVCESVGGANVYYMVSDATGARWKMDMTASPITYQEEVGGVLQGTPTAVNPASVEITFCLDGIRIYNTLNATDQATYYSEEEANVSFLDVRDLLLTGKATAVDYTANTTAFSADAFSTTVELHNEPSEGFAMTDNTNASFSYYFLVGPKNELYLNGATRTQALVLNVRPDGDGPRTLQIAAKLLDSDSFGGSGSGALYYRTKTGWKVLSESITSGTELYYAVDPTLCPQDKDGAYVVIIATGVRNEDALTTGGRYLSLTKLKCKGWTIDTAYEHTTNFIYEDGRIVGVNEPAQRRLSSIIRLMGSGSVLPVQPVTPPEAPTPGTCTEGHDYANGVCTVCGAVTDGVYGSSITLTGTIGLNFYLTLTEPENSVVRLNGEVCEGTRIVQANGVETWRFTRPVSAQDMHKPVTVTLTVGGEARSLQVGRGDTRCADWSTTVQDYLDQLAQSSSGALALLVKATSNYGHYAQLQFESSDVLAPLYTDDSLALTACTSSMLTAYSAVLSGEVDGLTYLGSSLVLNGSTDLRHYFRLSDGLTPDDLSVAVDAAPAALVQSDGDVYVLAIEDVDAQDLDQAFTLSIGRGDARFTLRYSALSYVRQALTQTAPGDRLRDTCRALYHYWRCAENYFNAEGGGAQ